MNGRNIEIPIRIRSAVAHGAGALRMICYLDRTDIIIGVESNEKKRNVPYLYAYPELRNLPIIGTGNNADPELIARLQPEVIICTFLSSSEADELQKRTGIPVLCLSYGDFNKNETNFYESMRLLGSILERNERAEYLINYIKNGLNSVEIACDKHASRARVYAGGIAFRGSHGINSTEPLYAPFRYAHAYNVAEGLVNNPNFSASQLNNVIIDKEQIIKWNPEKIFIDISSYTLSEPDLDKNSVVGKLIPAIQKDEVYFLLPHIWHSVNYEHILINTFYIAKVLYPDIYPDMDIKTKANEVYEAFLGKAIYDNLLDLYGMGCQKINEK
ncbi:MAG: ABC transporter substrate-binding protein [Bacteroidetes bacterium]|nr:ABC transporter substrate-binding protein [Bacteroidota bacterium]